MIFGRHTMFTSKFPNKLSDLFVVEGYKSSSDNK